MSLRRTPLFEAHQRLGGKLVDFAGWELPVQFSGILEEHRAVRTGAGLFDVSHMGEIVFEGAGALQACNELISNDLSRISDGQALYAAILNQDGGIVDDVICYRFSSERILVCANGANVEKDLEWLQRHARPAARIRDESPEWAQLALQGPKAQELLGKLTSTDLSMIGFFRFAEIEVHSRPALVARTGYTGEDGFEIFCRPDEAIPLWDALLEQGATPCGLGARDSLRLEAGLCLYGNELSDERTPFEAGLGWIVKMDKHDFVGKAALEKQKAAGVQQKLVGFTLEERGIPRSGYPILSDGKQVGVVTSGTQSPTLQKPIGLGYVPVGLATVGTTFQVEIRNKPVLARVIETPFYKRSA